MHQEEIPVIFQPQGKRVYVLPGTSVLEAATRAGFSLFAPCGGSGVCGKCVVRITEGIESIDDATAKGPLTTKQINAGFRLACKTKITAPLTVEIPAATLADDVFKALGSDTDESFNVSYVPVRKHFVKISRANLEDACPDTERLCRILGEIDMDLPLIRGLSEKFKDHRYEGTAVIAGRKILAFEDGDTTSSHLATAFDIGTTTIAGALLDIAAGREIASATRMNPQVAYGDDVIARIGHASTCNSCLHDLQQMVATVINEMILEMANRVNRGIEEIYSITIAGNTTMQHLLARVNPESLGHVPFTPVFTEALELSANELGLRIYHAGRAWVFPSVGGFVGGDTVACLVATDLHSEQGPILLVDVGTNGELVLAVNGKLTACSTAAGPAFEGARIRHGMRAHKGAIEKVVIQNSDVLWNVIGNVPPVGLCGSALLDTAAELRRHGLIDDTCRLLNADEIPSDTPSALRNRIVDGEHGIEFIIARTGETRTGDPVTICQKDLREMQLAVAAIRAGINILLDVAGLEASDLERLLLAGGFGNYIRRSNAQIVGLLP